MSQGLVPFTSLIFAGFGATLLPCPVKSGIRLSLTAQPITRTADDRLLDRPPGAGH